MPLITPLIKTKLFHTVILLLLVLSCTKKETVGLFTGSDLNSLSLESVDTFTVKSSTVALDSLPTFSVKNDNMLLVGSYKDPLLGTVTAQPYFQVSLDGTSFDLTGQLGLTLDSLALVLYYNSDPLVKFNSPSAGYYPYAGDTAARQTLSLFRLSQDYQLNKLKNDPQVTGVLLSYFYDSHPSAGSQFPFGPQGYADNRGIQEGYLFNTSSQVYDNSASLKTVSFLPRPRLIRQNSYGQSSDSVVFRLPDSIAQNFFNGAKNLDKRFQIESSTDLSNNITPDGNFLKYFKGLTVVPSASNSAVVSFNATTSHLRLFYRAIQNGNVVKVIRNFPIVRSPTLFNHIESDRSGTVLNGIKPFTPVRSEVTGNQTFIQAGTGLMTKIEFPYLYTFKEANPNITINRVELSLQTAPNGVNSLTPSIPWLALYLTDQRNYPISPLTFDFSNTAQVAPININPSVSQIATYNFSLLQFSGVLLNRSSDLGTAILVGPAELPMDNSVERTAILNEKNNTRNIKLKIYFSKSVGSKL